MDLPTDNYRNVLGTRWRATPSGPMFELSEPPPVFLEMLPRDYLAVVGDFGGREGFLGDTYLRLYRLQELIALNHAYDVPSLLPEVIVFGSNGSGEGFAFPVGEQSVIQVPFLPLGAEHAARVATSFAEFVLALGASAESPACEPEAVGMEVHDKHPICLGGSPTDPANKVLVPAAKHAEVCRYWNKVYRDAVDRERGSG